MSMQHAREDLSENREKRQQDIQLHGRWLVLARSGWVTLIAFTLIIFIADIPVFITQLHTICTGDACADKQLSVDAAHTLQNIGFSMNNYVIYNLTLALVWASVWFVVGAVIGWRKSNDWMGLLVTLWLVMNGTANITDTVAASHSLWQLPSLVLNHLTFLLLFLVFLLFPNGQFVPRWTRWLVVAYLLVELPQVFYPQSLLSNMLEFLAQFGGAVCLVVAQVYRYWRVSNAVQRQQTKWVIFSISVAIVGDIALILPIAFFQSLGQPGSLYLLLAQTGITFFTFLFPLSFGIAILRYRLYDIDILINRTLVYVSLTALLVLIYLGGVIGLEALLHNFTQSSDLAIVGSTLAIAALFQPLRHSIQKLIDRRFYRKKYDAARTLANFSTTLRGEVDLLQLQEHLVEVINETMQPTHVSLWLRSPEKKKGVTL